jgi:hypothetical protein
VGRHLSEAHLKRYWAGFDFGYTNRIARGVDDEAGATLAVKGSWAGALPAERLVP